MCELFAMSSREPATVNFSLSILAEHGGNTAAHKDGWGIAYYEEEDVRVVRDTMCASQSQWVALVEKLNLRSRLVVSHIRKATEGAVAIKNTQPFARELGGRMHIFAHNGHLPKIREQLRFKSNRYTPVGDTDSEFAFCSLLARLRPLWQQQKVVPDLKSRLDTVSVFAEDLRQLGLANFIYSDSDTLFVHGHRREQADGEYKSPGLYRLQRNCTIQDPFPEAAGVSVVSTDQDVVLFASVPLTREPWVPFLDGEIVVVSRGKVVAHS